jgi:hypothetical protein
VYVNTPGYLYPYRDDSLTGAGILRFITINYSPVKPATVQAGYPTIFRGFPSGPRGSCYLYEPGEWWIRIECGRAPGTVQSLPFFFWPKIEGERDIFHDFSRWHSIEPLTQGTVVAAATAALLISTQEMLDGLVAFELITSQTGANSRYRWTDVVAGNQHFPITGHIRFFGETLQLADFHVFNNGAANVTFFHTHYR